MKKFTLILSLIILTINTIAQNRAIDSTLVSFYHSDFDSIALNKASILDTNTFHANDFDPLAQITNNYSTLSNIGLAHKSQRFLPSHSIGFDMSLPAFNNYIKTYQDLKTYLSVLPYSEIRYVMTLSDKEQHLKFKFGRQFLQGLFLSLDLDVNYSPMTFKHNQSNNNTFWLNALYTTPNQRYGAMAYWFRNKLDMQENGGIRYDSIYSNHIESDNTVLLTNLSTATNYIKVSGAGFQQYFIIQPYHQVQTHDSISQVHDSLNITIDSLPTPKYKLNLGRLTHNFRYQRNQLFYNETSADLPFYAPYDTLLNTGKTNDSTFVNAFHNSIGWNNLKSQKNSDTLPLFLYANLNYDLFNIRHFDYLEDTLSPRQYFTQVSLSGGLIINLFHSTRITGKAQLITLGYQLGDFSLQGQWLQRLGRQSKNIGTVAVDFLMKRQSSTWFEDQYYSNHFRWDNDFHAATYIGFDIHYHFKGLSVGVKQNTVNDMIYFDQTAYPVQNDGLCMIQEAYANYQLHLQKFQLEVFGSLQNSSSDIVRLPLFLGRLKIGYSQSIFKKAATLQPSMTVTYFTKYYADAYMPATRTFYLQDEVMVGNYPYIDLNLAINVKQADIYVQYSNMFLLTGNYDAFIAPHYPMRGSKIFIGINWRLFN